MPRTSTRQDLLDGLNLAALHVMQARYRNALLGEKSDDDDDDFDVDSDQEDDLFDPIIIPPISYSPSHYSGH
jgi:hypothetical protein